MISMVWVKHYSRKGCTLYAIQIIEEKGTSAYPFVIIWMKKEHQRILPRPVKWGALKVNSWTYEVGCTRSQSLHVWIDVCQRISIGMNEEGALEITPQTFKVGCTESYSLYFWSGVHQRILLEHVKRGALEFIPWTYEVGCIRGYSPNVRGKASQTHSIGPWNPNPWRGQ